MKGNWSLLSGQRAEPATTPRTARNNLETPLRVRSGRGFVTSWFWGSSGAPAGGGCGIRTHGGFPRALSRRMHSATMRTLHGVSPQEGTAASAHHPTPMQPRPSRRRPLPPVTSGNQGAAQARTSLQDGRCAAPTARSRPRAASDLTGAPWVAGQVWTCGCGCSGPDGSVPTAAGRRRRPRPSSTRCRRSRCRGAHPPGAGGLEPPPPRRRSAEPPGPRRCGGSRHWP